jgi:hypothetical protein
MRPFFCYSLEQKSDLNPKIIAANPHIFALNPKVFVIYPRVDTPTHKPIHPHLLQSLDMYITYSLSELETLTKVRRWEYG